MARPLRIERPGALYHVLSRGNAREAIFFSDHDRFSFLHTLGEAVEQFGWLCHAYCLMPNHYHLLVETPEPNLSRGMRQLNGVYTQRLNRRRGRVGHLFQGRFKAILIERESHLLEVARYIVLNPVRAGMLADPEDHRWSSLRATLGLCRVPRWLTVDSLVRQFGTTRRYRAFVREGIGKESPCSALRGVVMGSQDFVRAIGDEVEEQAAHPEIPRRERPPHLVPLEQLFPPTVRRDRRLRNDRIREVGQRRAHSLAAVARHLGLHYSTVSKIASSGR